MFHPAQRLAREAVNQLVLHLLLQLETELEDQVRRVHDVLGHLKRPTRGFVQVLAGLLQDLGLLFPFLDELGHHPKRGDARGDVVLVAAFGHQREEARHDGHGRLKGHHVGVVADARAGVLVRRVVDILPEVIAHDVQEGRLRPGEEGLPDATSLVEEVVICDFLLIFVPKTFFHLKGLWVIGYRL